ncbi:hypothetical protein AO393_26215 [Pseudomonas syringae pv. syringae]|uniref:hypothetical protein n=1 Tax=Pseudomonas syringae TaxID=317 RepID=UPI000C12A20E|nr:hypothetical protein [Pseudomonas syringae]PHX47906.1 hypothetical protein AO393_26215 [Pseudomonas syringae pv. syringae]
MNDMPALPGGEWTIHPFSSMEPEALRAYLVAQGFESQLQLPILLDQVCALLQRCYPMHLLAVIAINGLQTPVSAQGVGSQGLIKGVTQPQVELLQALILTLPIDRWGIRPAEPSEIQQLIEDLNALTSAFYQERYTTLTKVDTVEERAMLLLQERVRGHTQFVRNWGYHGAVLRITRELYGSMDDEMRAVYGFGATDLLDIAKAVLVDFEQGSSAWMKRLFAVLRRQNMADMVYAFFREADFVEGDPEDFLRHLPDNISREQVAMELWSHADRQLVKLMLVDPERIALAAGRDQCIVLRVLEKLSRTPGSLSADTITHFFMGNPVWSAPCIDTGVEYLLPMPQLIFSHINGIMRVLLDDLTPAVKKKMSRTRADYLEAQVSGLLSEALPGARLQTGVKWTVGADRYETDVLLIIDRTVVIVEAKSAALSVPGLRGAPDRVKRHVQELIVEPALQSERLAQVIDAARQGDEGSQRILSHLDIDAGAVSRVIRLSVTLDDFSILASCESELREAGWVPAELTLAPTLNLTDLGCVVDILEEPAYILHYLATRGSIQRSTGLLGDELDYLGFYLQTAFGMGDVARSGTVFAITGMSGAIDRYYTSRDAGVSLSKPPLQIPELLRRMVLQSQCRGRLGWTTICMALLDVAYHAGEQFEDALFSIAQAVAKSPDDSEQPRGLAVLSAAYSDIVVAFFVFPKSQNGTCREDALRFAEAALTESGKARCVVVGRMLERWHLPYEFTAVVVAD